MALSLDEVLVDLWAIHFHADPEKADAPEGDLDFDETLRELDLDSIEWGEPEE